MQALRVGWKYLRAVGRALRLLVHVLKGLCIVALRFPALSTERQQAHVQAWARQLLAHAGISLRIAGQPRRAGR